METMITNIYELRSAQFKLQQKFWERNIEDVLRLALGKPLDGHGDARKSVISSKLRNVFRLLFRKWFEVGPDIQFTDRKALFNERGFRRATFNEGRGIAKTSCRRTWCRAIKALKGAGIIDAYQEPNQGDWWVRFNSDVVAFFHEELMELRKTFRNDRKSTPCDNDGALSSFLRATGSGSPSTTSTHSADCSDDEKKKNGMAWAASAVFSERHTASDSTAEMMRVTARPETTIREQDLESDCPGLDANPNSNSFEGVRLDEQKTRESIAFSEARDLVLEGATGKVVGILANTFPELDRLPAADLLKIKRLVSMPKRSIFRLDEAMARELCKAVELWPEVLKGRNSAGETLDFSAVDHFMQLLPFWRPLAKVLRQLLIAPHYDHMFDMQLTLASWQDTLFGKRPPDMPLYHHEVDNPVLGVVRLLANSLKEGWSTKEIADLADAARSYLLDNPTAYFILYARFPRVRQFCRLPDQIHDEILSRHVKAKREIELWEGCKSTYGFDENDFTPRYPDHYV